MAFGLQTLRALLSLFVYVLRDRLGWDPLHVGILALVIFGSGFMAGPVRRTLGTARTVAVSAGGLGLLRLTEQAWQGDPLVDLFLAIASILFFIQFLFAFLDLSCSQGADKPALYGLGFLLGVSLDTLVVGAFGTWEVFWREDAGSTAVVAVLVAAQLACLTLTLRPANLPLGDRTSSVLSGWRHVVPWLAIGPLIFLEVQIFQNLARLDALASWGLPQAFAWIAFSNALGLVGATLLVSRRERFAWPAPLALGMILTVALSFHQREASVAAATILIGQVSLSVLAIMIFRALASATTDSGTRTGTVVHGIGMLALTAFLFGYYITFELKVPFPRDALLPVAGAVVGLAAVQASTASRDSPMTRGLGWLPAALAGLMIAAPVAMLFTWDAPPPTPGQGYPVRVMTYNLHNGFNTEGRLNMEALARVIEAEKPDVVGLQEVSRGWAINGSMDMLEWLSHRLQMPYVYGPAAGPMWGNAILTRYPIIEWTNVELPPRDLQLPRQFVWARLDLGDGQELNLMVTHLHNREDEGYIREEQAQAILDFWSGAERTIVMGDLNAEPHHRAIQLLQQAGFVDALGNVAPGYTARSNDLEKRIDYILATPDLLLADPFVPATRASDHLPVLVTLEAGP